MTRTSGCGGCFLPFSIAALSCRRRCANELLPFFVIYFCEAFLVDGKQLIEHEVREVKKVEKRRVEGKTIIKRSPGDVKRVKRNRSRDAFKMRLGMGTVLEQSGDDLVEKAGGSALCRMSIWQYVLCQVETGRLPVNSTTAAILKYRDELKDITNSQGKQMLNGKHLQGKLMAKVVNMLFGEFVKAIAKK